MGQFKPMVKMMTTEPSVILKLKKGGHVAMPKGKGGSDFKSMQSSMPVEERVASRPVPKRVGLRPEGGALSTPMMKRGGKACMAEGGETPKMHQAEMKKMAKVEGELKSHAAKPASKAHAGLKTGGVVKGQGGFKGGGSVKKFAAGGNVVDSGKAEKMSQGHKKPSSPVRINELSGTFKKGGKIVKKADGGRPAPTAASEAAKRALEESVITPEKREMMQRIADAAMQDRATEAGYARATGMPAGSVTDFKRKMEQEAGRTVVPMQRKKGGKA